MQPINTSQPNSNILYQLAILSPHQHHQQHHQQQHQQHHQQQINTTHYYHHYLILFGFNCPGFFFDLFWGWRNDACEMAGAFHAALPVCQLLLEGESSSNKWRRLATKTLQPDAMETHFRSGSQKEKQIGARFDSSYKTTTTTAAAQIKKNKKKETKNEYSIIPRKKSSAIERNSKRQLNWKQWQRRIQSQRSTNNKLPFPPSFRLSNMYFFLLSFLV